MTESALYTSESTTKSLWQEYRIYRNRIEFDTHFGKINIPFEQIEKIIVLDSDVNGLLKGDLRLKNFRPALKLDWANFTEHIVLDKSEGHIRRILFTPDNPEAFNSILNDAIKHFKNKLD